MTSENPTQSTLQSNKYLLRESAKARRASLSATDRKKFSAAILDRILTHPAFVSASQVLAYASRGDEVDTDGLMSDVLAQGKTLLLPRVVNTDGELALHVVADAVRDLHSGAWGIREPDPERCPLTTIASADLIVVPGLAFTPNGVRLGYGKGYYDRLFAAVRSESTPPSIAPAFEVQVVDALPQATHDLPVDWIATETRLIDCGNQR